MRKLVVVALLAGLFVPAGHAASTASQQHWKSTSVLRFLANHHWMVAQRHERCSVPWRTTCLRARELRSFHTHRLVVLDHTLPWTNDWRTAVRLSQRIYPGTDSWLLYISDREGGWGPFVMNHQGSGAGGWLQFMASTFYAYVDDARLDVERRGFRVPPGVWTWTHPLGQALTGAYMRFTGRDGCHWCL